MNQSEEDKKIPKQSRSKIIRIFFIIAGFLFLALGFIGIAIPVLPTVPFFLLTSFCFVKGSNKFHLWFLSSRIYKRYLEGFVRYKSMNILYELLLLLSVSAMLCIAIILVNHLAMTIFICFVLAVKYIYFIVMIKPLSRIEMRDIKTVQKDE